MLPVCQMITARKRSLGQGNVFTRVCHSVHGGEGGLCMMSLPVWLPGPMFLPGVSVSGPMFFRGEGSLSQGSHRSGKFLKTFFQSGKSGENGVFSQNQGKNVQIREPFFKTIFKLFTLRKNVFKTKTLFLGAVRKLHLMRQYLHRLTSLRLHLKRINMFLFD